MNKKKTSPHHFRYEVKHELYYLVTWTDKYLEWDY